MNESPISNPSSSTAEPVLTVFFDGSCPICAREIAFYKRQELADSISWLDVSDASVCLPSGISRVEALKRLHVQLVDGKLVSGAAAFTALWQALPRFATLGKIASIPVMKAIAEWVYDVFLHLRPGLQACFRFFRVQLK